ncbi:MAG: type II toxin-antitoxin system YafQ family toxin [Ignavibacteriota bacterium]
MAKLRDLILLLIEGNPLPPRYRDHPLGGEWKHFRFASSPHTAHTNSAPPLLRSCL